MEVIICVGIVCLSGLFALDLHHTHQSRYLASTQRLTDSITNLFKRVTELEERASVQFDPKAFQELKSSVEALRIRIGLIGLKGG
jgi:hypothetical protein